MPSDFKKIVNKIDKEKNSLYSDIYYNDSIASNQIRSLKDRVNTAIEKISNSTLSKTGEESMSLLYQKAYGVSPGNSDYDLLTQINQTLSDRNTMESVLSVYTQNTLIRDVDREIDMVCKYMPKLEEALETRREHVLSADHFNKNSLLIKSVSANSSRTDSSVNSNIKTLKDKYDIIKLFDEDIYRQTDKYGEAFIYIIPYKKAMQTLLRDNNIIDKNINTISTEDSIITESAINDYVSEHTYSINMPEIIQESASEMVEDMTKKNSDKAKLNEIRKEIIDQIGNIKIDFNTSRIIKSAIVDRMKAYRVFRENASIFTEDKDVSEVMGSNKNNYSKLKNDDTSMASDGVTLLNGSINPVRNQIKIPGCIVRALDHEMVKPLYIDNICLGYFYIECDKHIALEQTTYSSTVGGIRPNGAYKGNFNFYKNASTEYIAIKNIASAISKKIDAKFINANQDLSKEIYSILKYNASVDASGKISKITISFIPPEDIEHCYFDFDPDTRRGVSGLIKSLFPAKLFSCLYISNVLQSITRGFDKRVYYVRQTIDTNIASTLMNVINQIQRSNFGIRQIESMSNVLNMVGRFNDLIIPRSASGEAPVDFEVIPGQQTEIRTELMNILEEMAINATDVPFEVINARQQVDYATHLTMTNTKFLQKIYNRQAKTQKIFSRVITKIYNYEYNSDNSAYEEIEVILPPPIYLNAVNTSQIIGSVTDLASTTASAYVNEDNDPDLLKEFTRHIKMDMINSLFPQDFIERNLDAAKLELTKKKSTED